MTEAKKKTTKKKATRKAVKRTATHGTFRTVGDEDFVTNTNHFRAGREYVLPYEDAREFVAAGGLVEVKG
tara:strand:+ start:530 stop:739 length:210 start_codon:yes stop_codon:yes gene_type:complete